MLKSLYLGFIAAALATSPSFASDRWDKRGCDDVLEDAYEEIAEFEDRKPDERQLKRFLDKLKDDIDEDKRHCASDLAFLAGSDFDDTKPDGYERRKHSGKKKEFCEDVVEDVLEELAEYDEERDERSKRRAKYVRYLIKDLDRDERKCVKSLVDNDNDVSPHKAKHSFDVKKWSYGKWSS